MAKKNIPKYGADELIQFVGLNDLSPEEIDTVNALSQEYFSKLKRAIKKLSTLIVHIKCYDKKDKGRKKFSLHLRCLSPLKIIESCNEQDWDLARALHKSFNDVLVQADHIFKRYEVRRSWKKKFRAK